MDITRLAIDKNRVFFAALIVVLLSGVAAYRDMPRSEDPGFIIRTALVQTVFPGASAERVELLVTDKLEKVIQEIPELDFVASTSKSGVSIIYVNIAEEYTEMRPIWDKLRRKVERARDELPEDVIGPTVNDEFGDVFGSLIALTGDGFEYRELRDIADAVRNELLFIPQAAKVEIVGAQDERVFVEYDNARLAEIGLSPIQLLQALQARNIILPGGDFSTDYERIVLEPSGSFNSVDEIRRMVLNVPMSDDIVRLQDIATVSRGYIDPPSTRMRYKGETALGLAVSMREGGNILELGDDIRRVIARAQSLYPVGVEFDVIQFQSDAVFNKVHDFVGNLLQAVLIVALVMLAFLGLRTGLVVASLIPSTMITAFLVMSVFDIGIDQMSLASLIIALGMLVDNAIVMSESIMVRMAAGEKAKPAAIASATELRVPLLVSSLTTAAAFLPIYLAESTTGEYTAPLFKVVTITLLCSWVIALTLIPVLAVSFFRVKRAEPGSAFDTRFYRGYRATLLSVLKRPWLSLAGVAAVFFVALSGFGLIPNIFFPPNDRPSFTIEIDLPAGSPIDRTDAVIAEIENFVAENLMAEDNDGVGIIDWGAFIGQGAPKFMLSYNPEPTDPSYGFMLVNATSADIITGQLIPPVVRFIRENIPDAVAEVRPLQLGPPVTSPVQIRISGRENDTLFAIADSVTAQLKAIPGAREVTDNWGARSKKVVVQIDETRARLAGVSHQDTAISLQTYLTGLETTEYREDDKLIPVVIRSEAPRDCGQGRERCRRGVDPARVAGTSVYSQVTGESVPLAQVATAELVWQPGEIMRRDRLRTITVSSQLAPGATAVDVTEAMRPWLVADQTHWPFGFSWEFGGEIESSVKANESIGAKMPIGLLIIVLLLVSQFNSFRRPLIILMTIPLSIIGVVFGLLIANSYFGFMTLLGIISLAGIVINNAIVLLDRIRIEQEENGLAADQAIIEAAQQRLRPILLTTATTIGGLIPLWLGGGPMWEPMAIAIIFGLLFATVLTLGVIPVLYSLLYRVRF
ncbi:MAG: efflux RND transporter permease subunit [Gammaproteobacteria bacterium]|nr:efflux RND transporter permease subunit [Gammaproteobacteria bacterium]